MFWKENHTTSSHISTLLEDENVTLAALLDDDEILQECKIPNKKLIDFLIRHNQELVQLITEEPSSNVDLRNRYRHSAMACEIIASMVPSLIQSMVQDSQVLGRLYGFLKTEPPLNPLLASFFAKTIEMLLAQTTQDWYTYQLMCLQVVEYLKSCQGFLPRMLQHMGTSAIMNCLQHITHLSGATLPQVIFEWIDSHMLIEKLIMIVCGLYVPPDMNEFVDDPPSIAAGTIQECSEKLQELNLEQKTEENQPAEVSKTENAPEKVVDESQEVPTANGPSEEEIKTVDNEIKPVGNDEDKKSSEEEKKSSEEDKSNEEDNKSNEEVKKPIEDENKVVEGESKLVEEEKKPVGEEGKLAEVLKVLDPAVVEERLLASQATNSSRLLCSFITSGRDSNYNDQLLDKCISDSTIKLLLESMFSSPDKCRNNAIVCGIEILLTLLNDVAGQMGPPIIVKQEEIHRIAAVIVPWLPNFKEVLLNPPPQTKVAHSALTGQPVGIARLTVARLVSVLVGADSAEVAQALTHMGLLQALLDMFLHHKWNNFLHTFVENIIQNGFTVACQKEVYSKHLLLDCKLMERITAAWEENDSTQSRDAPRCGYMGHIIQICNHIQACLSASPQLMELLPQETLTHWNSHMADKLLKVNLLHKTCLGGQHPSYVADFVDTESINQVPAEFGSDLHNMNFIDPDDGISDDNSEQIFVSMCERAVNAMDGPANNWKHTNLKKLAVDPDGDGDDDDASSAREHPNFYDDSWMAQENCNEWDDAEDIEDITPVPGLSALLSADSSPWGDVINPPVDQGGWADFGSLGGSSAASDPAATTVADVSFPPGAAAFSKQMDDFTWSNLENLYNTFTKTIDNDQDIIGTDGLHQAVVASVQESAAGVPTFADVVRHKQTDKPTLSNVNSQSSSQEITQIIPVQIEPLPSEPADTNKATQPHILEALPATSSTPNHSQQPASNNPEASQAEREGLKENPQSSCEQDASSCEQDTSTAPTQR